MPNLQTDVIADSADLNACLVYAMNHQPLIQQLKINEEINRRDVGIALSDWLPQIDLTGSYQKYVKQPVSFFPDLSNPEGPKSGDHHRGKKHFRHTVECKPDHF